MAELPKNIRVGYKTYSIEEWSPYAASGAGRCGECDKMGFVIKIRTDLNPFLTAEVLLHEVLHACYDNGCVDSSDEEKLVSIMGNQLTQVWRDNPSFVAFMSASLNPEPPLPTEQESVGKVVAIKPGKH